MGTEVLRGAIVGEILSSETRVHMRPSPEIVMKRCKCARGMRIVVPFLAAGVVLCAGQAWSRKNYSEWSAEDVKRVLTDSPWARQVNALLSTAPREVDRSVIPPPGASTNNMGGTRGVTDGRWQGGVGTPVDDSGPKLPVTIRWDSALPVREALLRWRSGEYLSTAEGAKDKLDKSLNEPQKNYIITVVGLLTNDQARDRERVRKGLMRAAKLIRTGKALIRPENITLDASAGAIRVFFPRTEPISLTDKEVTFQMQFGSMRVEKKFRLKAMTYKRKLEL
jgi:hypothetical protein